MCCYLFLFKLLLPRHIGSHTLSSADISVPKLTVGCGPHVDAVPMLTVDAVSMLMVGCRPYLDAVPMLVVGYCPHVDAVPDVEGRMMFPC